MQEEMRLVSAIIIFLITQYLKLFLLVAFICSLLRYSNGLRHVYVIVSEFALALVLALIMFASLALTKMHSNRLANYLLLPVLLGLGYINAAHYQRHTDITLLKMPPTAHTSNGNKDLEEASGSGNLINILGSLMDGSLVDSIELFACNGLASLSVMLLMGNLFNRQLAKLLD